MGSCVSFGLTHLQLVCVMQKLEGQSEMGHKKEDISISKTAEYSPSKPENYSNMSPVHCA